MKRKQKHFSVAKRPQEESGWDLSPAFFEDIMKIELDEEEIEEIIHCLELMDAEYGPKFYLIKIVKKLESALDTYEGE